MWKDTEHRRHVELPNTIGGRIARVVLFDVGAVVRTVAESHDVEAAHLALRRHVVDAIGLEKGRARRRRKQKVSRSSTSAWPRR